MRPRMVEYIWVGVLVLFVVVIAILVLRVRLVYTQRPRYAQYWRDGNGRINDHAAIHLVVLGDSLMQGIGASKPTRGLAGLAASHVAARTGRPVRVTNLSRTGAKVAEVLADQLPRAPLDDADVVLVCVSANDAFKRVPLSEYRDALDQLLGKLPREKTVAADVALVRAHGIYQPVMTELADSHGIVRADVVRAFSGVGTPLKIVAGDFFHPNDRGYRVWFSAFAPPLDELLECRGLLMGDGRGME